MYHVFDKEYQFKGIHVWLWFITRYIHQLYIKCWHRYYQHLQFRYWVIIYNIVESISMKVVKSPVWLLLLNAKSWKPFQVELDTARIKSRKIHNIILFLLREYLLIWRNISSISLSSMSLETLNELTILYNSPLSLFSSDSFSDIADATALYGSRLSYIKAKWNHLNRDCIWYITLAGKR